MPDIPSLAMPSGAMGSVFTTTAASINDVQKRTWNFIAASETGALSLDPNDSGNWTSGICGIGQLKGSKWGVSAAAFPYVDIANVTFDSAMEICTTHYWPAVRGDEISALVPGLAILMVDAGWTSGPSEAIKTLQTCLHVPADGLFGNITRNALQHALQAAPIYGLSASQYGVISDYAAERLLFESELPRWQLYKGGWTHRITRSVALACSVPS